MFSRLSMLEEIAGRVESLVGRIIVAVDGVDGSGKTTFADELAPLIERRGRQVVRASVDDFHNPRAVRYRRGKADPEGFFLDSYNYDSLCEYLIRPFQSGAAGADIARFNHRTDEELSITCEVNPSAVLLLDGIFLHRDELRDLWDFSFFSRPIRGLIRPHVKKGWLRS